MPRYSKSPKIMNYLAVRNKNGSLGYLVKVLQVKALRAVFHERVRNS